jgi:hypothetical protein
MTNVNLASAQNDALVGALLWLKDAPQDDRLYDISFGTYSDGTGCWWTMKLVTEVRNSEVQASPEDDEKKILVIIRAWREAYQETGAPDE